MTDDDRLTAAALLLLAAALLAWWLWGKRDDESQKETVSVRALPPVAPSMTSGEREFYDIPGFGRVMLATDEESEYWREKYAPPEGWNDRDNADP